MSNLEYKNLTPEQQQAVDDWWSENDPDGYTYDCTDNYRYAVKGNLEQQDLYYTMQNNGCCGFVDVELEISPTETLLFGFNYGH